MTGTPRDFALSCPIPISDYPRVLLAHGGGGRLMHQLIGRMFAAAFSNPLLDRGHDGAVLPRESASLAFSTDSFVVSPLFFPGGDIGSLAVHGTANDLAMCGAEPRHLSAAFILEEGLEMETLWRIVRSMAAAATEAGVAIVTGDTKVVERGKGDGVFINTAGIGIVRSPREIGPSAVRPGDAVVLSGDIGRHGMAILQAREGLAFESAIESDAALLTAPALALLEAGIEVHCLRDLTRGGLASALIEIAELAGCAIDLHESAIPVRSDVRAACEILGLDPLYVANEGRFAALVAPQDATRAVHILAAHPVSAAATQIGEVLPSPAGQLALRTAFGTRRIVDMLSGEQLPRIC